MPNHMDLPAQPKFRQAPIRLSSSYLGRGLMAFWLALLPLPPIQAESPQKILVGHNFPAFSLPGLHKQGFSNDNLKGKVAIIDFWASWCGPCKEALPFYQGLAKKLGPRGLIVLGISVDEKPEEALHFLATSRIDYPNAHDQNRELAKRLGVGTIPTAFILDRKGRVVDIHRGFLIRSKVEIEREVEGQLAKK